MASPIARELWGGVGQAFLPGRDEKNWDGSADVMETGEGLGLNGKEKKNVAMVSGPGV